MRTLFQYPTSLLLFALGAAPYLAAAQAAPVAGPVTLTICAPSSLRLRVANPDQLPSRVQVVRVATGQLLFADAYRTPAYGHRFNFDGVPAGRYLLRLRQGRARYCYRVQVDAQALVTLEQPPLPLAHR